MQIDLDIISSYIPHWEEEDLLDRSVSDIYACYLQEYVSALGHNEEHLQQRSLEMFCDAEGNESKNYINERIYEACLCNTRGVRRMHQNAVDSKNAKKESKDREVQEGVQVKM